ncbi:MAG: hypothetical protein ABJR46_06125 [Tateyamaria sp.]|uniref:hypothetical protein n=1 Tax=Tateyamaria sp. TaxID=1929288 RepID=UPI0032A08B9C
MKPMLFACCAALLSACAAPSFVGDAAPITITTETPEHFDLPARFAVARVVYGSTHAAGAEETSLWTDLADRATEIGSFTPLVIGESNRRHWSKPNLVLVENARAQRYDYLIKVQMYPSEGSAEVTLFHTGSAGVMATVQVASPGRGQRGFWGGRIKNPARLDRATLKIAKSTIPKVEDMLNGALLRQR